MAKVIQGHRLHSNQYLLARVYDANALEKEETSDDAAASDGEKKNKYVVGQILVIKGTEYPFYIPPTGMEVIPIDDNGNEYVRDAVTLEKLEYCILKNEAGDKKYIHGSAVVFPEPDESFVRNPEGGCKFRAIELSEISGIYVKVISDYEEKGVEHPAGEELFITGKDQMIYYPRPEHAIISYEGKVVHHAVAIPEGEGRYILERKTGKIKMVRGAAMYLINPIEEVMVKRKLTAGQCSLWYPGNEEVMLYNTGSTGIPSVFRDALAAPSAMAATPDRLPNGFLGQENVVVEEDSGFSRRNAYAKPRTITIDDKYDGVVSIAIWTGYAINVISKSGNRKVVTGPQTYLMEYDETLEELQLSTGKPKTSDKLLHTVYLRTDNNKISDIINVQTKDFVEVNIKVSYCVDFLETYKDKWFSIENYVKYLCDRVKSLLKREVKKYSIEEFYENATDIVRNVVLNHSQEAKPDGIKGRLFAENGMLIHDVEVLSVRAEDTVQKQISERQYEAVKKALELSSAEKELEVTRKLTETAKEKANLSYEAAAHDLELKEKLSLEKLEVEEKLKRANEEAELASKKATEALQGVLDKIQKAELARKKAAADDEIALAEAQNKLYTEQQNAYAAVIEKIMASITPELVAAMESKANADLLTVVSEAVSPYAIANAESVTDTVNKLLRGTSLEGVLGNIGKK
ncbi:MAG: hypothetical protein LUH07_04165 [Lachnospiraceae bacterium]|nr:hypothetical protein [Lachnospiraceae bacterium]